MGDKLLLVFALLLSTVNCQSTTITATSDMEKLSSVDDTKASPIDDVQRLEPNDQTMVVEPETGENKENADDGNINSDDDRQIVLLKDLFDVLESASSDKNETTDQSDDSGVKIFTENLEEPIDASGSENIEVRSQGGASESGRSNTPTATFTETKEMNEGPLFSPTPFEAMNEQLLNAASTPENTPVLQLTQGGYQRPYQPTDKFNDQSQKLSSESATQQGEAVESPNKNLNNGERFGRAQIPLPSPFFPSPFQFNQNPLMSNPFAPSMNIMRTPNAAFQNSFYNTQPATSQRQYSQLVNPGEFPGVRFTVQTAPRAPLQNFGLFQNPFQFPIHQPVSANVPGQMSAIFQPNGSPAYSNFESELDSPASDFASLFTSGPASAQFQENPNPYGSSQSFGRNIFGNPSMNPLSDFPNIDDGAQFSPRLMSYPMSNNQPITENGNPEQKMPEMLSDVFTEKQGERVDEVPKEDIAVPFGARIQKQNDGQDQNDFKRQDNVYIRYPMTEAGYATEDNLPAQNDTEKKANININEIPMKETFPFFTVPRRYNVFDGPDPYKIALENVKREYPSSVNKNSENKNNTEESESESMSPEQTPLGPPDELIRGYPERNTGLSMQDAPFYAEPDQNPFQPIALFPGNTYPFAPRPIRMRESNKTPTCAQSTNASLCFDDPEYPRGEMLYALNSNPIIMDRLAMPDQQLEDIPLVEQNKTETLQSEDNYICKSDIKYGLPLRAKNVKGNWKIIVNIKGSIGRRKFVQPVRLEVCREGGNPCSFIQVKTACVQKYSLQRLLSWSMEKGVHSDVFKLPVACSCQLLEEKA